MSEEISSSSCSISLSESVLAPSSEEALSSSSSSSIFPPDINLSTCSICSVCLNPNNENFVPYFSSSKEELKQIYQEDEKIRKELEEKIKQLNKINQIKNNENKPKNENENENIIKINKLESDLQKLDNINNFLESYNSKLEKKIDSLDQTLKNNYNNKQKITSLLNRMNSFHYNSLLFARYYRILKLFHYFRVMYHPLPSAVAPTSPSIDDNTHTQIYSDSESSSSPPPKDFSSLPSSSLPENQNLSGTCSILSFPLPHSLKQHEKIPVDILSAAIHHISLFVDGLATVLHMNLPHIINSSASLSSSNNIDFTINNTDNTKNNSFSPLPSCSSHVSGSFIQPQYSTDLSYSLSPYFYKEDFLLKNDFLWTTLGDLKNKAPTSSSSSSSSSSSASPSSSSGSSPMIKNLLANLKSNNSIVINNDYENSLTLLMANIVFICLKVGVEPNKIYPSYYLIPNLLLIKEYIEKEMKNLENSRKLIETFEESIYNKDYDNEINRLIEETYNNNFKETKDTREIKNSFYNLKKSKKNILYNQLCHRFHIEDNTIKYKSDEKKLVQIKNKYYQKPIKNERNTEKEVDWEFIGEV